MCFQARTVFLKGRFLFVSGPYTFTPHDEVLTLTMKDQSRLSLEFNLNTKSQHKTHINNTKRKI